MLFSYARISNDRRHNIEMEKIHITIYDIKTEPVNMSCSCTSGCDCGGACSPSLTQADDFKSLEESFAQPV